tara:strand:- start:4229 stop:5005 length:777 start_codon:yes stop_codon:yes gene_type:complete
MINTTFELFKKTVECVKPLAKGDNIKSTGELTIEQFIEAGDKLIKLNPKWIWSSGTEKNKYLPNNKQFLIMREVECINNNNSINIINEKEKIIIENKNNNYNTNNNKDEEEVFDDNYDIDLDVDLENLIDYNDDDCVIVSDTKTDDKRYYDIHIIYDMYFNTPRVYLFGYNYNGDPISYNRMLDDVQQEYVSNTLTLEKHPHISLSCLSLHPCKHSNTMKNLIKNIKNFKNNLYLVLFIKIISSLIPKLNYDIISVEF